MAIYLGPSDLASLMSQARVTPADCIDAVAASFREHGSEDVGVLPRQILWANAADTTPRAKALKLSAAYMRQSRVMGASLYSTHFTPGKLDMWLTVFCGETGRMLGIVNGQELSLWKTAATAAVATRHLARPDASRLALIGTGNYARAQLIFMAAVMKLEKVSCFSRTPAALAAFCDWATDTLGVPVDAAASVQRAVEDADVVTTITTSPSPVLAGNWLAPGVHCNVMGQHAPTAREVDTEAIAASRVIVDANEQAFQEKGEILIPIAEGAITREHIAGELGAVVAGRCPGRTDAAQKTMFCSGGTAFEYMGLCKLLLDRAAAADIGQIFQ